MVGEACLPSNAYYPQTPDYTLYSGVHVCWSEHSDSSFVYGFMSLDYGLNTMTATTYTHLTYLEMMPFCALGSWVLVSVNKITLLLPLLRARRNEKEMKVKPATSFKLLTIFIHKKMRQDSKQNNVSKQYLSNLCHKVPQKNPHEFIETNPLNNSF